MVAPVEPVAVLAALTEHPELRGEGARLVLSEDKRKRATVALS